MRVATAAICLSLAVTAACTSPSDPANGGRPAAEEGRRAPIVPAGPVFSPPPLERATRAPDGWLEAACDLPHRYVTRLRRGFHPGRSPDVIPVPREPSFFGAFLGQSHSGPWDYLQEVPLVFYGPGFIRERGAFTPNREVTVADLAPTLAELIGTDAPATAAGRTIAGVLRPEAQRPGAPRVVVTVVWDGGGNNVLEAWPNTWPNLARMMANGAAPDATIGSSPSITPSVHATMGTGAWPKQTGIVSINQRVGNRISTAYPGRSPHLLEAPTLADSYDLATGNRAEVGLVAFKFWHLGLIGHGAAFSGGDRDDAVIVSKSEDLITNPDLYSLPEGLAGTPGLRQAVQRVDLDDGKADLRWMGHKILDDPRARRDTPVWAIYQTRLIEALMRMKGYGRDEVPDLLYTNYKQPDEVGHVWNMLLPEMKPTLEYADAQLGRLERFLDRFVGRRRWVMVVTADHGQGVLPEETGAWPINMGELADDIGEHFGVDSEELLDGTSAGGFWLDRDFALARGIGAADVSRFLVGYRIEDNVLADQEMPAQYLDRGRDLLFDAAFPAEAMGRVWACSRGS